MLKKPDYTIEEKFNEDWYFTVSCDEISVKHDQPWYYVFKGERFDRPELQLRFEELRALKRILNSPRFKNV